MKKIMVCTGFLFLFFAGSYSSVDTKDFFPELDEWELDVEEKTYDVTNLWELINGAADVFFTYDFRNLSIASYKKGDKLIRVEIYQHGNPDKAFGIYRAEKMPDYTTVEIGVEGYVTEGAWGFNTDKYYVKVMDQGIARPMKEEMETIAFAVHKSINGTDVFPEEFKIMPGGDKIDQTEGFVLKNFIGYEMLKYAFTQDYHCGEGSYKLFIMNMSSEKIAEDAMNAYFSAINYAYNEKQKYYLVNDPFNGKLYMGKVKNFLFGAVYFQDECDITVKLDLLNDRLESAENEAADPDAYDIDGSTGSTAPSVK